MAGRHHITRYRQGSQGALTQRCSITWAARSVYTRIAIKTTVPAMVGAVLDRFRPGSRLHAASWGTVGFGRRMVAA